LVDRRAVGIALAVCEGKCSPACIALQAQKSQQRELSVEAGNSFRAKFYIDTD